MAEVRSEQGRWLLVCEPWCVGRGPRKEQGIWGGVRTPLERLISDAHTPFTFLYPLLF